MAMGISKSMSNKEKGCLEEKLKTKKQKKEKKCFPCLSTKFKDWPHEGEFETITGG